MFAPGFPATIQRGGGSLNVLEFLVIWVVSGGGGGGHNPQRPTESSDPTQHAKGRTGDRPGPRKGATTRRNVTQGGGD